MRTAAGFPQVALASSGAIQALKGRARRGAPSEAIEPGLPGQAAQRRAVQG